MPQSRGIDIPVGCVQTTLRLSFSPRRDCDFSRPGRISGQCVCGGGVCGCERVLVWVWVCVCVRVRACGWVGGWVSGCVGERMCGCVGERMCGCVGVRVRVRVGGGVGGCVGEWVCG